MKNKKIKLIFLLEVFLISISFYADSLPKYNQVTFLIKHLSLFAFLAIILILSILLIRKLISKQLNRINKDINKNFKKWGTVIVFGVGLYMISSWQVNYIEEHETPYIVDCSYYDVYGHKLYESSLPLNCSKPLINEKTDEFLSMSFSESVEGVRDLFYVNHQQLGNYSENELNGKVEVTINVEYEDKKITNYEIEWLLKVEGRASEETFFGYKSYKKVIKNTYLDNKFISDQMNYSYEAIVSSKEELDQVTHYNFTDEDCKRDILTVTYEDINDNSKRASLSMEYIDLDGLSTVVKLGTGTINKDENGSNIPVYFNFKSGEQHDSQSYVTYDESSKDAKLIISFSERNPLSLVNKYKTFNGLPVIYETTNGLIVNNNPYTFERYTQLFSNDLYLESEHSSHELWKIVKNDVGYRLEHYDTVNKNFHLVWLYKGSNLKYYEIPYLNYEQMLFYPYWRAEIIYERNPIIYS